MMSTAEGLTRIFSLITMPSSCGIIKSPAMPKLTYSSVKRLLNDGFEKQALLINAAFQNQTDHMDKRFDALEQRMDKAETRLETVEHKLDRALYKEIPRLDTRIDALGTRKNR
jgi:hypothetical protein